MCSTYISHLLRSWRTIVCDSDGHLKDKLTNSQILAYVPFTYNTNIYCCADNSVLFSAMEIPLPSTPSNISDTMHLFKVNVGNFPVMRLSTQQCEKAIGNDFCIFGLSPDKHYLATVDPNARVYVLDLHTGELQTLQNDNFESSKNVSLFPHWRNSDELTFVAHATGKYKNKHAADLVLWSISKHDGKILSTNWPKQTIKDLFE